jgi:hypothetical protein
MIVRALVDVTNCYSKLLPQHTLFSALAAVAAHLSPTAFVFFKAGGTIAAVAQLLHQPPLFLEAARRTATRFSSCHRNTPSLQEDFSENLAETIICRSAPPYRQINPKEAKVNRTTLELRKVRGLMLE